MTSMKSGSYTNIKPVAKSGSMFNMNTLRTIGIYTAMAVGVTVGGVIVGAVVVAPAVSRATPLFSTKPVQNTESNGSVGQADGDGAAANVVATESFKPITEAIAAATQIEAKAASAPKRSAFSTFKRDVGYFFEDALDLVGRVPKITWVYVDVALVALFAGVWFYRRRNAGSSRPSAPEIARKSTVSLPSKFVSGKGSRTPKHVVALAEAGTAPADIARHTGLPLDAVAMLLSLGSLGARQLQPPTA